MNLQNELKMIDKNLSDRHIHLDPKGYFIIRIDLMNRKIILEHYLNNISNEGYAINPETNKPIECNNKELTKVNAKFIGNTAKEIGILITEKRNDLISKFDHALYLGRELQKAEDCILNNSDYIQD